MYPPIDNCHPVIAAFNVGLRERERREADNELLGGRGVAEWANLYHLGETGAAWQLLGVAQAVQHSKQVASGAWEDIADRPPQAIASNAMVSLAREVLGYRYSAGLRVLEAFCPLNPFVQPDEFLAQSQRSLLRLLRNTAAAYDRTEVNAPGCLIQCEQCVNEAAALLFAAFRCLDDMGHPRGRDWQRYLEERLAESFCCEG